MNKEKASEIQRLALNAIENLSLILNSGDAYLEYPQIKKGIALSIGKIQMDILEPIYKKYPELDNLK